MTTTKHLTDSSHVDGPALDLRHEQAKATDLELSHDLGLELLRSLGLEA